MREKGTLQWKNQTIYGEWIYRKTLEIEKDWSSIEMGIFDTLLEATNDGNQWQENIWYGSDITWTCVFENGDHYIVTKELISKE